MGKAAVALVPGFMGYEHLKSTSYFTDRFTAGLAGVLAARGRRDVAIFPLGALPSGSLAARQRYLLAKLDEIDRKRGPFEWHLVGHGTGGMDSAMLARTQRLIHDGQRSDFGSEPLNEERVRSVTTLSTPHYGTGLTLAPLPRMTHGRGLSLAGVRDLARGLADTLAGRDAFWRRVSFGLATLFESNSLQFLYSLLGNVELAADLDPVVSQSLTDAPNRRDVPLYSIATMAPKPGERAVDLLYRDLWTWTASGAERVPEPPRPPSAPGLIIAAHPPLLPEDPRRIPNENNDGVVNTARQIDPKSKFAALVLADHVDAIGSYQRVDIDGHLVEPGLMTSEADFNDATFATLLAIIGEGIAETMSRETSSVTSAGGPPAQTAKAATSTAGRPLRSVQKKSSDRS